MENWHTLATSHMKLVYYLVNKRYGHGYGWIRPELYSDGMVGLCKAAMAYDETIGIQFSTFAARAIYWETDRRLKREAANFALSSDYVFDGGDTQMDLIGHDDIIDIDISCTDIINTVFALIQKTKIFSDKSKGKVKKIFVMRYLMGMSQQQIGVRFGVSKSAISLFDRKLKRVLNDNRELFI